MFALLGFSVSISAQDLNSVFLTIPDEILLGLTVEDKNKLISQPNGTDTITVENALGGNIKRLDISRDYISLETSKIGNLQIKVLPLVNNSKIICVIKTVCGKACDSNVRFYTTDWTLVSQAGLSPEKDLSWFLKSDIDKNIEEYKNATVVLDMNPVKFILSPDNLTLTAQSGLKEYLSSEDYKKIKPFLSDQGKVFTWDKISFK